MVKGRSHLLVMACLGGRYYALTFNGTLGGVVLDHQLQLLTANPALQFRYSFYDHLVCVHFLPVTTAVNSTLRLRAAKKSVDYADGLQLGWFDGWHHKVGRTCSTACSYNY